MILFKNEHVEPILNGTKTQTRRLGKKRWNVGAVHQCRTRMMDPESVFARVRIEDVYEELLYDISNEDARAEGYADDHAYVLAFNRINPTAPDDPVVWVVKFELVTSSGGKGRTMSYVNMKAEHPWWLTFICCGREDGVQSFETWEKADALRESYCAFTAHDRTPNERPNLAWSVLPH